MPRPSRGFSAIGTAPHEIEEGRDFLQSRLASFSQLGWILNAIFYVLAVLLVGSLGYAGGFTLHLLVSDMQSALLIHVAVFGAAWMITRRGKRAIETLYRLDTVTMLGISVATSFGAWSLPPVARPELIMLITLSNMHAIRAAMIPSSASRSGWLSAATTAPAVVLTYFYYVRHPLTDALVTPFGSAVFAAFLALPTVIVSSYVSRTIYGLTQQVRQATQLGQYTLDEKIGEGGMGIVFKARHSMLRRPTAVKLLPPTRAGEHNLVRFEREVQLTSLLTHPNTVSIYDFGRTPEGVFYYAMEYLDGIDLEGLVEQDGPLDAARTIHILMQVAGALEEAHGIGLIHRDIKPANILLCERGTNPDVAKVFDFGLVKRVEAQSDDPRLSAVNAITGTPLYLSPEAILTPDQVDGRSDLYSLGCVGYYLLTGASVFDASSVVELCGHHIHTAPTPPSERLGRPLPADLEATILACLEKSPANRPADASALHERLRRCTDASAWDPKAARTWWKERGHKLRRRAEEPAASSLASRPRTINVDVAARASRG